jgi:ABC-type bacteriocin/lantibiotic exporter with double-glycine peptidase domain
VIHDLPTVRQRTPFDCGPAVCRSVLRYYDRRVVGVDRILRPTRKNGTPPDRLAWLFIAAGLHVHMRSEMTLPALRKALQHGPVLCPIHFADDGHWVAVRGIVGRTIHLMDPAKGPVDMLTKEFEAVWYDASGDGVTLNRFGLCISA